MRYNDKIGNFRFMVEGNMTFAKSKVVYMDEALNVAEQKKEPGILLIRLMD